MGMNEQSVQTAPPVVEGLPQGSGSQESAAVPQGTPPTQETTSVAVDNGEQHTSSQDGTRLLPSEHFTVREIRRENKALADSIAQMQRQQQEFMQQMQQQFTAPPKRQESQFDPNKFWTNPDEVLSEREKRLQEDWSRKQQEFLEKTLPERLGQFEKKRETERQEQEALELIFPKSPDNPNEPFESRRDKDQFKKNAILEIFETYGLDAVEPKKAAKFAIKVFKDEYEPKLRNPNAPSKAQMASTASGMPVGGPSAPNQQTINEQLSKMNAQVGADPSLFRNEQFMAQWNALRDQAEKTIKGNQK